LVYIRGSCVEEVFCGALFFFSWVLNLIDGLPTGIQAFEMMGIAAVGNNLITYVFGEMHFPLSRSANIVTNFIGTVFLLSLLGGFLSDSYLGSFWTMLIFGFVELSVSKVDCIRSVALPESVT
jgi:hypothetical protein